MLSKHTYFIVAGSGIFVIIVVFSLIQLIQKNHYKIITDNDVKILYGWSIEPRDNKSKSDYIFSLNKRDSLDYNIKPINFYSVADMSEIKLPYRISYDNFMAVLELKNSDQVKEHLNLVHEIFKATGAIRIVSDMDNDDVIYFTYGRRIQTLLIYIPANLSDETAHNLTQGYRKIDGNWYYRMRLK
jgi:hypothetical protein